jgi:hypothetical protein
MEEGFMNSKLPEPIIVMMAARDHRLHHYLWHQVRNLWWEFSEADKSKISSLGWEPPRKARTQQINPQTGRRDPDYHNDSGEDFLYMHRVMIANVNEKLAEIGDPTYPKVVGWQSIPAPNDAEFPVPPAWDTGDAGLNNTLDVVKSDEFYQEQLKPREDRFKDPAYLSTVSLGELGARIEFTAHNWMHMRFCSQVPEIRPDPDQFSTAIDPKWDDPAYDWLGDTYSSHVNPVFWKLHGWVDDRIEDWKSANNLEGPIPWRGTWVGDMPVHPVADSLHAMLTTPLPEGDHDDHHHHHDEGDDMAEVLKVIIRSGKRFHFYDDLLLYNDG